MSNFRNRTGVSVAALAAAMVLAAPAIASAADAAAAAATAAPAADDTLATVVVTASSGDRTKLTTSTSISSVNAEAIQDFNATSTAELYRMIPGIQVPGTQGDGGNSNISVRGLRTPTGGSPFVQIQEDGLPTVLFGDIQFGNNDYWTHPDPLTERVEGIRGGTASTLASQAVGAVLNHISATGRNEGGFIQVEKGVNYDYTRLNFRDGGIINDTTYYNVGGYYDVGRGIEHAAYNVSNSYSVKGNITKELPDNKGYIRLLFKSSDTQEPSYNGCISSASLNGHTVSSLGASSLCDGRNQAPGYSSLNQSVPFLNANGTLQNQDLNGISTKENWIQLQTHYDYGNGLTVDDNARVAKMSGTFAVQFYGAGPTAGAVGTGQSLIYADGPNAGKAFTGAYVSSNAAVHTNMGHMDHIANDLSGHYKTEYSGAVIDLKAGFFYYSQHIAEDWHSNGSINEASGNNPAELDLVSGLNGTGNLLSAYGQTGFNQGWNQQFDMTFTDSAPYADLNVDLGKLNLDGSIRQEDFNVQGWAQGSSGNPVGTTSVVQTDPRTGQQVTTLLPIYGYDNAKENANFTENSTNWSLGALYKVTDSLSVFTRASHGTRFNADRLTRSTPSYFAPDGSLSAAGQPNAKFPVTQYELGTKNRGELFDGHYTVEATAFYSEYKISSQEINAVVCSQLLGHTSTTCVVSGSYHDSGLELFTTYHRHGLNVMFSATYDHSTVQSSQGQPWVRSPNIPDLTYSGLISYNITPKAEVGFNFDGQTDTLGGDGNTYPGSVIVGAFGKYRLFKNIEVGVEAYNAFNEYTAQGPAGFVGGSTSLVNAGVAQGQAVKASLKFSF